MNIKLLQNPKIVLFLILICLFANFSNVFSQNLSLEDLLNLQKELKPKINSILLKKSWKNDLKNPNIWISSISKDLNNEDDFLVLRDANCNKNILYYILNDAVYYKNLKEKVLMESNEKDSILYQGIFIYNCVYNNLYFRFYETNELNQKVLYSLWVFSKEDAWYFGELNKFCLSRMQIDTNEKPIELMWGSSDGRNKPQIFSKNDTIASFSFPEFPGGEEERVWFFENNLRFPLKAKHVNTYNNVILNFNIEKDGSVSNISFPLTYEYGIDDEVIRVINLMPRWKPATIKGVPVRTRILLNVYFNSSDIKSNNLRFRNNN